MGIIDQHINERGVTITPLHPYTPTQVMSYFQHDEEKLNSFIQKTMGLTFTTVYSNLYSKKFRIRDIADKMGIYEAGNSSKTLDFFTFCKTNGSDGITKDGEDHDVTTSATTTSTITEITASNDTTEGIHPDFKTSRPHKETNFGTGQI